MKLLHLKNDVIDEIDNMIVNDNKIDDEFDEIYEKELTQRVETLENKLKELKEDASI